MEPERREDEIKRDRIDEIAGSYSDLHAKYLQFNKQVRMILVCLMALVVACFVVEGLLIAANGRRTNDVHSLAAQAKALAVEIQDNRRNLFIDQCRETNQRNANTIEQLHREVKQGERTADLARKAEIKASITGTIQLINALVPSRPNCVTYADQQLAQKQP